MNLHRIQTKAEIEKELSERSYYDFFRYAFRELEPESRYKDNWHIQYLCDMLQRETHRIARRGPKQGDIIINIMFRSLKSMVVTVCWQPWAWIHYPWIKFVTASYSSPLSIEHAVKSRRLINTDWYQMLWGDRYQLSSDQNIKSWFENTEGGKRYATSVGGTLMGTGGDVILVDDPVNPKQAHSDMENKAANTWYDETFYSRINDPEISLRLVIMQRLRFNDLTAYLESKQKPYQHICIPGEISDKIRPANLAEYYTDGLFFPERFPKEILEDYKVSLGSYGYAGQVAQDPAPEGGAIWQQWFIPVSDNEFPKSTDLVNYGTDWDLAYTKDDVNSASAYLTSGKMGQYMYIDALGWAWKEFPGLIEYMKLRKGTPYIEAKASGKSAKQTLNAMSIPAVEVPVKGGNDKEVRARMATPFAEAGLIKIRASLIDQLYYDEKQGILKFPVGANTDLADVLAQAIQRHFRPQLVMSAA